MKLTQWIVLAAAAIAGQIASAQTGHFSTTFGFETPWGVMPAGRYEASLHRMGNVPSVLLLRNVTTQEAKLLMMRPADLKTAKNNVTFACADAADCQLVQVNLGTRGYRIPIKNVRDRKLFTIKIETRKANGD